MSSFVMRGRDALPREPGDMIPSPLVAIEDTTARGSAGQQTQRSWTETDRIASADRGVFQLKEWLTQDTLYTVLDLNCSK